MGQLLLFCQSPPAVVFLPVFAIFSADIGAEMIRLAVFLGNPGKEYKETRHNAGFLFADYLYPLSSWKMKFHSMFTEEDGIRILKPMTMMNLSGTAVSEAASFYKLKSDEILIIHDDLELPLGKAKLQKGGGLQGHNGLRSIKERLGTDAFYRLRIGIGRPVHGDVRIYVTSPFKQDEKILLSTLFGKMHDVMKDPVKEREFS